MNITASKIGNIKLFQDFINKHVMTKYRYAQKFELCFQKF